MNIEREFYIRNPGLGTVHAGWNSYVDYMNKLRKKENWNPLDYDVSFIGKDNSDGFRYKDLSDVKDFIELSLSDFNFARTKGLPKYWIVDIQGLDKESNLYKTFFKYLDENNDSADRSGTQTYYGYDGNNYNNGYTCGDNVKHFNNGYICGDNVKHFNNNPAVISLQEWYACMVIDKEESSKLDSYKGFEPNKTIKQLGIDPTRKFVVIDNSLSKGTILTLQKDDNSTSPFFTDEEGEVSCFSLGRLAYYDKPTEPTQEKQSLKVGDTVMISEEGKQTYQDSDNNPHGVLGTITAISNPWITVEWNNGGREFYREGQLDKIEVATQGLSGLVRGTIGTDAVRIDGTDSVRMDSTKPEMSRYMIRLINRLTELGYITHDGSMYKLSYKDKGAVISSKVYELKNFDLLELEYVSKSIDKIDNTLIINNLNMKTEMNKILVEEFVTNKANRKSLKEMKTFIKDKVNLLQLTSRRLDAVGERLQSIGLDLDYAMDRSDIETVERLMGEFDTKVKEFITVFLDTEIKDVVDIKKKEEFDVEKFFNN